MSTLEAGGCWSSFVRGAPPPARETCLVGVFDGEGSGPEVVRAAMGVLEAVAARAGLAVEIRRGGRIGSEAEDKDGVALTAEAVDFCRGISDGQGAVLHCAGGGRFVYQLRRQFDLFCKISPVRVFKELHGTSRLKQDHLRGVDMLFVRENAGGVYQGASRSSGGGAGGRWWSTRSPTPGRRCGALPVWRRGWLPPDRGALLSW